MLGKCLPWSSLATFALSLPVVPCLLMTHADAASDYPSKPIRLIVPNAPGGAADATGRIFGAGLAQSLGKQVLIENRAGAAGNIATEIAARASPDGYTLALTNASHAISVSLYKKLGYDLVKDFAPISLLVTSPYGVTVNPALGVRSIQELVAYAKSQPGGIQYGSSANGNYLAGALLADMTGIKLTNVAYKGGAPTLIALLANEVPLGMTSLSATLVHVRSGKLRVLAVSTAKRSPAAPDIPTVAESGVAGYEASSWYGLVAPLGTSRELLARLHGESLKVLKQGETRERLQAAGLDVLGTSPEELTRYTRSEIDKWAKVVKATGLRVE